MSFSSSLAASTRAVAGRVAGSGGGRVAFASSWGVLGQQRQRGTVMAHPQAGGRGTSGATRRVGGMTPPAPPLAYAAPFGAKGARAIHAGAVSRKEQKDDDVEVEISTQEVVLPAEAEPKDDADAVDAVDAGAVVRAAPADVMDPKEKLKKSIREMMGDDTESVGEFDQELQKLIDEMTAEELIEMADQLDAEEGEETTKGVSAVWYDFEDEEIDEAEDERYGVLPDTFTPQKSVPMLDPESKKTIYSLHKSDPTKYTNEVLADKFKIHHLRVDAIIRLERIEADMISRGLTPEEQLAYDFGKEMEGRFKEEHGYVSTGDQSEYYEDDMTPEFMGHQFEVMQRQKKAPPRPVYRLLPMEDARDLVEDIEKTRKRIDEGPTPKDRYMAWLDKVGKAPTDVKPLEQWHGVKPTASKRYRFVFADISKDVKGPERWITVRDTDGTFRAANYDERRRTEQIISPPKYFKR